MIAKNVLLYMQKRKSVCVKMGISNVIRASVYVTTGIVMEKMIVKMEVMKNHAVSFVLISSYC